MSLPPIVSQPVKFDYRGSTDITRFNPELNTSQGNLTMGQALPAGFFPAVLGIAPVLVQALSDRSIRVADVIAPIVGTLCGAVCNSFIDTLPLDETDKSVTVSLCSYLSTVAAQHVANSWLLRR